LTLEYSRGFCHARSFRNRLRRVFASKVLQDAVRECDIKGSLCEWQTTSVSNDKGRAQIITLGESFCGKYSSQRRINTYDPVTTPRGGD